MTTTQALTYKKILEAAEQARKYGDNPLEAARLYQQAIDANWLTPGKMAEAVLRDANCRHMMGVSLKMCKQYESAITCLTTAYAQYSRTGDKQAQGNVLRDRAACWAGLKKFFKAREDIKRSLSLLRKSDPPYWATIGYRGRIHLLEGKYNLASRDLGCADSELLKLGAKEMQLYNMFHLIVLNIMVRRRKLALLWLSDADRLNEEYGSPDRAARHRKLWLLIKYHAPAWLVLWIYRRKIGA